MEWLQSFSDNELAVVGSLAALLVSFGLLAASFHLGRFIRQGRGELDAMRTPASATGRPSESTRRAA